MLLAAGAGRRFGGPKALADTGSGPWVLRAIEVLAGCEAIVVVIGAAADRVAALLPGSVQVAFNAHYASGMGSSLALGLQHVMDGPFDAAVVTLVDLPDVTSAVVDRLLRHAARSAESSAVLARAAYSGRPGHPVLVGRDHFPAVIAGAVGDAGARDYLLTHDPQLVECGDVGGGRDIDTPAEVRPPE